MMNSLENKWWKRIN